MLAGGLFRQLSGALLLSVVCGCDCLGCFVKSVEAAIFRGLLTRCLGSMLELVFCIQSNAGACDCCGYCNYGCFHMKILSYVDILLPNDADRVWLSILSDTGRQSVESWSRMRERSCLNCGNSHLSSRDR